MMNSKLEFHIPNADNFEGICILKCDSCRIHRIRIMSTSQSSLSQSSSISRKRTRDIDDDDNSVHSQEEFEIDEESSEMPDTTESKEEMIVVNLEKELYRMYLESKPSLFFEISIIESPQSEIIVRVLFGKLPRPEGPGSNPNTKKFPSFDEAKRYVDNLVKDKLARGYSEPSLLHGQVARSAPVAAAYNCRCDEFITSKKLKGLAPPSCIHLRRLLGELNIPTAIIKNPSKVRNSNIAPKIALAHSWDRKLDPSGYIMSEKLDGMRGYWDGSSLWTRNGVPIVAPAWFTADLPRSLELDGEIYLGRQQFRECMHITRRSDGQGDWTKITYVIFDAPRVAGGIIERLRIAQQAFINFTGRHLIIHPYMICEGKEHVNRELKRVEALGGEGLMLRHPSAEHVSGRTYDLLKVKSFHDDEALVVGYEEGVGKYKGMIGALICVMRSGAKFNVSSGLTDVERKFGNKTTPAIGSVITFKYFEIIDGGFPRFPVYVRPRPDVSPTEFPTQV